MKKYPFAVDAFLSNGKSARESWVTRIDHVSYKSASMNCDELVKNGYRVRLINTTTGEIEMEIGVF